jgi:acetylornithine deacetylase/succinyl-diaminopimelate desuccinylase-like protein
VRLADPLAARHPDDVTLLERLVRIPSVSGPDPDSEALARSAEAVAGELDAARLDWVRIVDATCSADSSTNTTDKLRERICAPYGLRPAKWPSSRHGREPCRA